MTYRRTQDRIAHIALISLLLGCSSTTVSQGTSQEAGAGTAGQSATRGGTSATSVGAAGISGGGTTAVGVSASGAGATFDATSPVGQGGSSSILVSGGTAGSTIELAVAGAAGSVGGTNLSCDPTACAASGTDCKAGTCQNGICTLVNRDAGTTCEGNRVCSGTGICGDCVPNRGKCDGRVPSVCNAEGHWVAASACGLGDQCNDAGACISPRVGWALSANGSANAEIEDLALLGTDSIVAAIHAEPGNVVVDSTQFNTAYPDQTNATVGVSRTTGRVAWSLALKSTDWAYGSRLGVATDTTFIHGFRFKGSIGTSSNPNAYDYGAFIRGYNAARAVQFTQMFNPIDTSVGPEVQGLDGIVALTNGAFVLLTYEQGLSYAINDNPGYATLTESNAECATVLSRLDASGVPLWNKQFAWCTDANRKVLKLGPSGDLYIGGAGCRQNGSGPLPVLDSTTLKSEHSGVIARLRASDGSVVKVVEFEGISTSYGRVDDLAFLPDGSVVALVSASHDMTFKIGSTEVPGGTYLVRLDSNLNLVKFQYLGTAIAQDAYVTATHLAATPNGTLYVAGTFVGDFDFGGGTLSYLGTCSRCASGDAFVASFGSDFTHRWSRAISSSSYDNATAVVAENGRAYVSVLYGATALVDGTAYAPTASVVSASTLFAFVE